MLCYLNHEILPNYACFQAEIKRLQEANKAARKERQLLLKQQEEIERMRSSTLRLKERLKCAGGEEPPVSSATVAYKLHRRNRFKGFHFSIYSTEEVDLNGIMLPSFSFSFLFFC